MTPTLDIEKVREIIRERGIKVSGLAKASDFMSRSHLSAILNGWQRLTPDSESRIKSGMARLGIGEEAVMIRD